MGYLVNGVWNPAEDQNVFIERGIYRPPGTTFRGRIAKDGSTEFPPELGRYRLYVSLACPWSHSILMLRQLKHLQEYISVSVTHPDNSSGCGWHFADYRGAIADYLNNYKYVYQLYTAADPKYTGRASVPVLWDDVKNTIVSNDAYDIMRMLDSEFDSPIICSSLYPKRIHSDIHNLHSIITAKICNGIYQAGYATDQSAYEEAANGVFQTLNLLENRLSMTRYLFGSEITVTDLTLFSVLVRFDMVYYPLFKLNKRLIESEVNLSGYMRDIYQLKGIDDTVNFDHIRTHYFNLSHLNPSKIIPIGPDLDLDREHNRERLSQTQSIFSRTRRLSAHT